MSEHRPETARQVKVLIHKARGHLERGQPREAMKLFHQVLQIEPNHPYVQQWVAKLRGRMKKPAGVGASPGPGPGNGAKLDETVLSAVKTDVYPAGYGGDDVAARKSPPRPRPRRPQHDEGAGSVELDTTVPGRQPGVLERTAQIPGPPATAASGGHLTKGAVPRTPPTEVTVSPVPPLPLDTTDPDVSSLLAGSGLGSNLKRLRPLVIGVGVFVFLGSCLWAFSRHANSYRLRLEPGSLELPVQRGAFFFAGWSEAQKISIGYDAAWQQRLEKPELIEELRQGKNFRSGPEVDAFIVSLFTRLGDRALENSDPSSMVEAIYYLKQARRIYERERPMPPEEVAVRRRLVEALLRYADYHAQRGEVPQAKDTLSQARNYDPTNSAIAERLLKLDQPRPEPSVDPATKEALKPDGKKPGKKGQRPGSR
jgi:tetratricopeptide (TPR) repeat protein